MREWLKREPADGLNAINRQKDAVCRYRRTPNFIHFEHKNIEPGGIRYLNGYYVSDCADTIYAIANLDRYVRLALNNPSFFDSMLQFHIENHYPKLAQGLKGEWPKGIRLVLACLPGEDELLWIVAVPNPGVPYSTLRTKKKWVDFVSNADGRNVAFNYLNQTCYQLMAEVSDDSFANSLKVMARGAWQGVMWWMEREERRLKKQFWNDLLDVLTGQSSVDFRTSGSGGLRTSFAKPDLFRIFENK